LLTADIPLTGDLNSSQGREVLAVTNRDDPIWSKATFTNMRRWRGEDISCLNLTKPGSPTILSVPPSMAQRNAFTFVRSIRSVSNKWDLLSDTSISPDAIPVLADDETAEYILHLRLGKTLDVTDQTGTPRKLILVATLAGSIFQGELLMAEQNFRTLFPSQSGAGVVLIDVAPQDLDAIAKLLGNELGDFSVTTDRTADVLAMYKNVQNTYLATFQVLGSLGLLLGTVGLAVVLLRGLIERKPELAMLAAIGFRRADRLNLVLAENIVLLLLGLAVGALCALIAVLPTLLQSARHVHIIQTLLTLAGVLVAGITSLVLSVWFGGRNISPADLRSE
jgi:ABC-type antimicrobial peptide transport system permease subunit